MTLIQHMQMPLIVFSGFLMAPFFMKKFPVLFSKWNEGGWPGMLLFLIVLLYWMLPRTMDQALESMSMEIFKFISLAFLGGVPLRDSWRKFSKAKKNGILLFLMAVFAGMGLLYLLSPVQLCNNYLRIEQITLGWGFMITAACICVYLLQLLFINPDEYE
ncbi:hypothetical protein P5G51_013150 [Virgibacillus sp. 179-BFC.A HS]|uniref:Transmembrane protein n=1 Tax=Tigheibacillus jepli TaxID=3035914 RepID=A0ABU5CIQ2_9BACI|nr:hypothetical protein [Virgibacillus sp. 179-BFC.A HS]MDY0406209.1 hypothetical protein [Virgibacillus sp. 179-BFC.A HS]